VVSKGLDPAKDQSYVLWGLAQEESGPHALPHRWLPQERHPRKMAVDSGFPELAKKSESYEICFIPDNDYRGFLKRKDPEATEKLAHGKLVGTDGCRARRARWLPVLHHRPTQRLGHRHR
jgi:tRNA-specific 2-thiouridylase